MSLRHLLWLLVFLLTSGCIDNGYQAGPMVGYLDYGIGDFDGDHRNDLVILYTEPNTRIAFNDSPNWTLVDLWQGESISVGDFDGDGTDDIARFTGPLDLRDPAPLRVWMGGQHRNLSLAFTPEASREISACGWEAADYLIERPGEELLCDFYDSVSHTYEIFVVTIGETIDALPPALAPETSLGRRAHADFDGDGVVDVVFAGSDPHGPALWLLRNLGNGEFEITTQGRGMVSDVDIGELDGAPGLDLVYLQLGGGYPRSRNEPARIHWAAWEANILVERSAFDLPLDSYWVDRGDIDLDNRDELLVVHPQGLVRVDFDGASTPTMVELDLPRSGLLDADADGDLDYVRYDEELEQVIVLHNDGTGTFTAQ